MKALTLPPRVRSGDAVALVSPSWFAAGAFPHRVERGQPLERARRSPRLRLDPCSPQDLPGIVRHHGPALRATAARRNRHVLRSSVGHQPRRVPRGVRPDRSGDASSLVRRCATSVRSCGRMDRRVPRLRHQGRSEQTSGAATRRWVGLAAPGHGHGSDPGRGASSHCAGTSRDRRNGPIPTAVCCCSNRRKRRRHRRQSPPISPICDASG